MSIEEMNELAPKKVMFWNAREIRQIEGFWFYAHLMESVAAFRSDFQPKSDDILITSFPKTGTTWLVALCHNILHRDDRVEDDVLTRMNPHELVPTLDVFFLTDQVQDLVRNSDRSNQLLQTHLPYTCLPEAVRNSGCKIVHVTRNPKDTLVSMWHFFNKIVKRDRDTDPFPLEGAVESFCNGVLPWGPFYEHVVGYWEESRKRPDEVLFLTYEDLCRDPKEEVRKLASFLGKPFSSTSSVNGDDDEVEKVLWRSSLGRLKELEVNKNVVSELTQISNSSYFRKGTVGDWKNYLTPQMSGRVDQLTQLKLQGTGLSLDDF